MSLWKRRDIEVTPHHEHFSVAGKPTERVVEFEVIGREVRMPVVPRPLPPVSPSTPRGITSEWARRLVGPAPPGRVVGECGKCRTRLAVSAAPRPLRVCCPECGRARVLDA